MNDSLGNAVSSSHDANGNLTGEESKKVEGDGTVRVSVTVYEYDQLNRLTRKTVDVLGDGRTTSSHRVFKYDSSGTELDSQEPTGEPDE
jgi:hypothetical protein